MSAFRKNQQVYFTHPVNPANPDSIFKVVTGVVCEVVWQGTTNEYLKVVMHNESGLPSTIEKKSSECFSKHSECREHAILSVYEKLDKLTLQLRALGDHNY
jgi:hypothetical protein